MLQITPQHKVLVSIKPVDFRKGIDGLIGLCTNQLKQDPFSGYLFVFRNRKATSIKILSYDSQGFWLCTKRLSKGRFKFWPENSNPLHPASAYEMLTIIYNGNPQTAKFGEQWKPVKQRDLTHED
ncbi:MAG: IS66 family insertion sequence element accessory protein TnpB [archaeon]|nr:IS66 family insertion sequence element accessory protein TnpB [archaeon]